MRRKTWKIIFLLFNFLFMPICVLFFEGLRIRMSILIPFWFFGLIIFYFVKLWWANVKIKNPKAIHDRGVINISGTEPFVISPAEYDEHGNMTLPEFSTFLNEGIHIPSKYISMPGGGEDGYTTVPSANIIKVKRQLQLNTCDISPYIGDEEIDQLPPNVIEDIIKKCDQVGYLYSTEFPHYFGWASADHVKAGDFDMVSQQMHLNKELYSRLKKQDRIVEYWRDQAISKKQHETPEPRYEPPQQQGQNYQDRERYGH